MFKPSTQLDYAAHVKVCCPKKNIEKLRELRHDLDAQKPFPLLINTVLPPPAHASIVPTMAISIPSTARAIVCAVQGEVEVLQLQSVPVQQVPAADEIIMRVEWTGYVEF